MTTKTPTLESPKTLHVRLRAASRYVPLERLALSSQCSLASVAIGNNITPGVQERKLTLVTTVARQV